jgi:23S rRNA (guanosine2251-2'-O)-methyltransferase
MRLLNHTNNMNSILILDNIRSTHNVGAIFRTADAVGVSLIYLVGYTPAPVDRFGKMRSDVAKSALGAEQTVPWKQVKSISGLITSLKKKGYCIVALEQSSNSISYTKVKRLVGKKPIALIVGNEVDGVSEKTLTKCDIVMELPMRGIKESLNVSVATGIALYELVVIGSR